MRKLLYLKRITVSNPDALPVVCPRARLSPLSRLLVGLVCPIPPLPEIAPCVSVHIVVICHTPPYFVIEAC